MPDQQPEDSKVSSVMSEIGASLASLRARYTGVRPVGSTVTMEKNVLRWMLPEEAEEAEPPAPAADDGKSKRPPLTEMVYRRETSAVVREATGRKVFARMSKRDKKTGVTTETFVLEEAFEKN